MFILSEGDMVLREFVETDIQNKLEWINNPENNLYLHYDIPLIYDKTLEWFRNKNNDARLDLVIVIDGIPVGLLGLLHIDVNNRKAEFYISMGVSKYKNRGIATRATLLLIKYSFTTLKLHKIYLTTDGANILAQKLFERVGFKKEGIFEDDLYHRGQYIQRIRYGLVNRN